MNKQINELIIIKIEKKWKIENKKQKKKIFFFI